MNVFLPVSIETTLYVLDTDYTQFALLFSCVEVDEESKQGDYIHDHVAWYTSTTC